MMLDDVKDQFFAWIDGAVCQAPRADVVAFCFNLYEATDSFHVQLVGSSRFDQDDRDWACDEVYTTGEDVFVLPHSVASSEWTEGFDVAKRWISEYLRCGPHAALLRSACAVAVGFVDGDITILHPGNERSPRFAV